MDNDSYLSISVVSQGVYREKGSKFYSYAYPVINEEEIEEALAALRKQYHERCSTKMNIPSISLVFNGIDEHTTNEYGVEHPPWQYYPVTNFEAHYNISHLYGPAFEPYLNQPPASVFIAHGSAVMVRQASRYTDLALA